MHPIGAPFATRSARGSLRPWLPQHVPHPATLLVAALIPACSSEEPAPPPPTCLEKQTCRLEIESGSDQSAAVDERLDDPLVVRVVDENGQPAQVTVRWSPVAGGGRIQPETVVTDASGLAEAQATTGTTAIGPHVFEATIEGLSAEPARFLAAVRPGRAENLVRVGEERRMGVVGQPLEAPLQVRVLDRFGNGIPGFAVQFRVSAGEGSVEPAQPMTDERGLAATVATLGPRPVNNVFTVSAEGTGATNIAFQAEAVAGPPYQILRRSGDEQQGLPFEALEDPLGVEIRDELGNPVEGAEVTFAAVDGVGGSVEPARVSSDAEGQAQARALLGSEPGTYLYEAEALGPTGAPLVGSPVSFSALAFPPICSPDGWCWRSPLPQGNTMFGAYSASPNNVWVVGTSGAILQWNGAAWVAAESGVSSTLRAVHGSGERFIVAVGDSGIITRYDGARWTGQTSPTLGTLSGVWLAGDMEGWAVGVDPTDPMASALVLRFDGTRWSREPTFFSSALSAVHGRLPTDVWAVGQRGTVLRYDGMSWTEVPTDFDTDLNGVWVAPDGTVWIAGDESIVYRYDGSSFSQFGLDTDGRILRGIFGVADDEIYAFGDLARVYRFDGTRFTRESVDSPPSSLHAMSPIGDTLLVVGGDGTFLRRGDRSFSPEAERRVRRLQGIWGAGPDRAFAVGAQSNQASTLLEWDGRRWSEANAERLPRINLIAVTGTSATDVWAVGGLGSIFRLTESGWSEVRGPSSEDLLAVWPLSRDDAFIVGDRGTIMRFDGSQWRFMTVDDPEPFSERLTGVYGASPEEVWAVGDRGAILRFDGTSWTRVQSPNLAAQFNGVRGTARDDVWAWGASGILIHFDGVEWREVPSGTDRALIALWPFDRRNAVAVGLEGTIVVRTNGGAWRRERSGTSNELLGVWGSSPNDVWVVGGPDPLESRLSLIGTILRKRISP